MPVAKVNGVELYYEETGEGVPSSGTTSSPGTTAR
jgi:hypothetical protein